MTQGLRIAHSIEALGGGGAERAVVDLATRQHEAGHDVTVRSRGGLLAGELPPGVHRLVPPGPRYRGWAAPRGERGALVEHVHSIAPLPAVAWHSRRRGGPWVFTVHGWEQRQLAVARHALRLLRPTVLTVPSTVLVRGLAGLDPVLVPNAAADRNPGARLPERPPGSGACITVARLHRVKGIDVMLRAVRLLLDEGQDLHLTVCGDGPERSALESLAAELDLRDRVRFLGRVDPHPHLAQAGLFLSSSLSEGLSLAQLEALMWGLPLVLTPTSGAADVVVPGVNGEIASGFGPQEYAQAVRRGLTLPAGGAGRASRGAYEDRFTLHGQARHLEALYRAALA